MLKAEGIAGTPTFCTCRHLGKAAMDRRISPPRFHSHCFSSPTWGSVPVGFLSCESALPTINRPSAEIRIGCFRLSQTRQRSHRKFGIDPHPHGDEPVSLRWSTAAPAEATWVWFLDLKVCKKPSLGGVPASRGAPQLLIQVRP